MKPSNDTIKIIVGLVLLAGVATAVYFTGGFERPPLSRGPERVAEAPQVSVPAPFNGEPFMITSGLTVTTAPTTIEGAIYDPGIQSMGVKSPGAEVSAEITASGDPYVRSWRAYVYLNTGKSENEIVVNARYYDGRRISRAYVLKVIPPPSASDAPQSLSVSWLEQPVRDYLYDFVGSEKYQQLQRQYDGSALATAEVYKLGYVRGGTYNGFGVYWFHTGYCGDGMGCFFTPYRVLRAASTSTIYYLPQHSLALLPTESGLMDYILADTVIPDLVRPDRFSLYGIQFQRRAFEFFGDDQSWFNARELVPIARHPDYGVVYTTPSVSGPDAPRATHAFYLRTPDNRVISYGFTPPFVRDERIPEIIWSDGSANASDYTWTDLGGCGSTNAFAVRTEAELRPDARLVVGGATRRGDPVLVFKDPNDQELKDLYDAAAQYASSDSPRSTYAEFLAKRPAFYWKDPFNRWIRFVRTDVLPAVECGKPVIYLYPPKETDAKVFVGLKGPMTKSEPAHGTKGWSVVARPDGFVVNKSDGKTYPNLYWEGFGVNYETPKQGFVVEAAKVDSWLAETLGRIGLTERESREFREFWTPRLPSTGWVFVTFVPQFYFDRDAPLRITPKPDAVYRIFMEWKPLAAPATVESLPLPKIIRRGFTVVEWGGALH